MGELKKLSDFNRETFSDEQSEFEDKDILCVDCGKTFVWTEGEQIFFRDKGLRNAPKRCKPCKQAKNERLAAINAAQAAGIKQRIEVAVTCARCKAQTTVPFYPSQGRPVYCRSCFLEMNPSLLNGSSSEDE
ncbi:MAG: zinc-ribbon domain containing protein [Pyrinomonadaceae bacterium]